MIRKLLYFNFILLLLCSCKKDTPLTREELTINDGEVPDSLKINELQYLGSHNSYRLKPDQELFDFLIGLSNVLPAEFNSIELDYEHLPIKDQLSFYGIRQLELDLFLDQHGGLYYNRRGYGLIDRDLASGIPELQEPGIKIMHIPDIDYNAHQLSFKSTLEEIKSWSEQFPEHLPIFILLELSEKTVADVLPTAGFAQPENWNNSNALNSLEQEILSVFERNKILIPDDVRGNYPTLNEAVLNDNWPSIGESRGKVVFIHNNTNITNTYRVGAPSLENKLIFTNSSPGEPDAAFMLRNSINSSLNDINQLADLGYMIRTRVDAGTYEARDNDYSKWILCLQSGAHFLSTDYYRPDPRAGEDGWSSYHVGFDNGLYRNNPITSP
jgi:hypothetical protein